MRAKEIWGARKRELKREIGELEEGSGEGRKGRKAEGGGSWKRKREMEREGLKKSFRVEKERRGREKGESKESWGRRRRVCEEAAERMKVRLIEGGAGVRGGKGE